MRNEPIIKKKRRERSIFCEKKPSAFLVWVGVYLEKDNLWVACKGRVYQNGWMRYSYQGKQAKVNYRQYYYCQGATESEIREQVSVLNLQFLEGRNPGLKRKSLFDQINERYGTLRATPIVAEEPTFPAPDQPTQPEPPAVVEAIPYPEVYMNTNL